MDLELLARLKQVLVLVFDPVRTKLLLYLAEFGPLVVNALGVDYQVLQSRRDGENLE